MKIIETHLNLSNPRFICEANGKEMVVSLVNKVGEPATSEQMDQLAQITKQEFDELKSIYASYNGASFHEAGVTAGLVIAAIDQLQQFNDEWQSWLEMMEPEEVFDFQKHGVAFATIEASGNFFVMYQGQVFYSDHDDPDEKPIAKSLEAFLDQALNQPAQFLNSMGCYTRYFDGDSDLQYIPKLFVHG